MDQIPDHILCPKFENIKIRGDYSPRIYSSNNKCRMEAALSMDLREWYLRAVRQFGWSKTELIDKIAGKAHEEIVLDIGQEVCDNVNTARNNSLVKAVVIDTFHSLTRGAQLRRCRGRPKRGGIPWRTMLCPIFMERLIVFMRC